MTWESIVWSMPLESQPIIVHIGENTHGAERDERYVLRDFWTIHLYAYEAELEVDGLLLPIKPGYIGINPPGSTQIYHFLGRSPHLYAHFSIAPIGPTFRVPAMHDLKGEYGPMVDNFKEAVRYWTINQQRSAVRLWDILWQMADVSRHEIASSAAVPPVVQKFVAKVDAHLHEPTSIELYAQAEGLSHNHFTRIFRASQGQSPLEYIQSRRSGQAKHLLMYTSVPLKAIAASIGISDPQIFNKFVKHYLGVSPKRLRDEGQRKIGFIK